MNSDGRTHSRSTMCSLSLLSAWADIVFVCSLAWYLPMTADCHSAVFSLSVLSRALFPVYVHHLGLMNRGGQLVVGGLQGIGRLPLQLGDHPGGDRQPEEVAGQLLDLP